MPTNYQLVQKNQVKQNREKTSKSKTRLPQPDVGRPAHHEALVFIASDDGVSESSMTVFAQFSAEIGALIVGVTRGYHGHQMSTLSLVGNPTRVTGRLLKLGHVIVQILHANVDLLRLGSNMRFALMIQ